MKRIIVLVSLATILFTDLLLADDRYVVDELTITMRSGRSNQHQIIKLLKSGDKVEVLEEVEDNDRVYARIRIADKEGWVHAQYLSSQPIARDRLPAVENRLAQTREQSASLKKELASLKTQHKQLLEQNNAVKQELQHLKQVASRPVQIAQENRELQDELSSLKKAFSDLQESHASMKNNSERDWFIAGGGVVLVSIIFGILLTRIRLRPRKSSWRDSI